MPTNPTIQLPTAFPIPDGNNQLPSLSYLASALTGLRITGLDRANHSPGVAHFTSAGANRPAGPATGEGFYNTGTNTLEFWTGSEWLGVIHAGATAPVTTTTGVWWYDTTLLLLRKYETRNGLTGWHPISSEAVLRTAGGTIAVGATVRSTGLMSVDNGVAGLPTLGRLPITDVVGVAAESATVNEQLVVWANRSGVVCGAVITGTFSALDILAADAGGSLLSAGPESFYTLSGDGETFQFQQNGLPAGSFARVVGSTDAGTGLTPIEMIGTIGSGRYVALTTAWHVIASLATPLVFDDLSHDIAIPTSSFISTKHVPYAVRVQVEHEILTTAGGNRTLTFSRTSSAVTSPKLAAQIIIEVPSAAAGQVRHTVVMDVPTNATAEPSSSQSYPSGHGLFLSYAGTASTPATDFNTLNIKMMGYWI